MSLADFPVLICAFCEAKVKLSFQFIHIEMLDTEQIA